MSLFLTQLEALERARQNKTLNLIASENYAWPEVLQAMSSVFGNKYAEGVPGRRFYNGCQHVDELELYAQGLAMQVFGAEYVNLQPHSGSCANQIAYDALLAPGDTVLAMSMQAGGHLTHGHPKNLSAKFYNFVHYQVDPVSHKLDFNQIEALAKQHRPKLIIAGASAYPRTIDFKAFADIAKQVGARFMADIAHIAGLVAAGLHPSPVGHADIVTMTSQKTLRGPRGGIILSTAELASAVSRAVMPGVQGGPHINSIFAKAIMLEQVQTDEFKIYQQQIIATASALAISLVSAGISLSSGGTDNHLMLLDVMALNVGITGKLAANMLEEIGIVVNANLLPFDPNGGLNPSGMRLGTPALAARGLTAAQAHELGQIIAAQLLSQGKEAEGLKLKVQAIVEALSPV